MPFDALARDDDLGIQPALPQLDWSAPPIAGPRWYEWRMLALAAAGVLILAAATWLALVLT